MKQTLLNSAGALALVVALGSSAALAADNATSQYGPGNLSAQEFLNGSENGNGSGNTLYSGNDDDYLDLDAQRSGNRNGNRNGNDNTLASGNDNDYVDVDADVSDVYNDKSNDDNDHIDLDLYAKDVGNDKSQKTVSRKSIYQSDESLTIGSVAYVVSDQYLEGLSAAVVMHADHGNIQTGGVSYGEGTNTMAAGNMTTSNNTGAGTVAQAAAGIQANGTFAIGAR
jgi:hypothetical protein